MTIRVVQVRAADDPIREHEQEVYRDKLREAGVDVDIYNILEYSQSPEILLEGATGIIIGGAAFSLTDDAHIPAERALLEKVCQLAYDRHVPLLGVCYGHQIVSTSFGGTVEKDTARKEDEVVYVHTKKDILEDPVLGHLPERFLVRAQHEDHVQKLPEGAVHLLHNELSPVQGFRLHDRPMYGVQFHPELNLDDMMYRYIKHPERYFLSEEHRDTALRALRAPDDSALQILHNFAMYAKDCTNIKK